MNWLMNNLELIILGLPVVIVLLGMVATVGTVVYSITRR